LHAAPLRTSPNGTAAIVDRVDANQTLALLATSGEWVQVRAGVEVEGWLPAALMSDRWIKVWKKERKLHLMKGDKVERTLRVALSPTNPDGNKVQRGDSATPEGRFFIAEPDPTPDPNRYGARSLRLSYPTAQDARRGLRDHLIDRAAYVAIVRAVRAGEVPSQKTNLGGSIRIHGGGSKQDWTLGCIGLDDEDAIWLYARVGKGTRVDVYASAAEEARLNQPGFVAHAVLTAGKKQMENPAKYTIAAMKASAIRFPDGDIQPDQAVCSDIIVRALRGAGLDLQALLFEDRTLHPERYPGKREAPRPSIDHRRVRNLVPYLQRLAQAGSLSGKGELAPGDIVIFDTGIANGTRFDHIGIVDDQKDGNGQPRAINIWTVGFHTDSMSLIGKSYPTVVAWFRLGHPLAAW
ncbi:MAG TPA: DUF1287 domain-containing protein, partial [Polyangia bacterium]